MNTSQEEPDAMRLEPETPEKIARRKVFIDKLEALATKVQKKVQEIEHGPCQDRIAQLEAQLKEWEDGRKADNQEHVAEEEQRWEAVFAACQQAWPEQMLVWNVSPAELIIRIINERDTALAAKAEAERERDALKKDAIHKATPFTAAACLKIEEENENLRASLGRVGRALEKADSILETLHGVEAAARGRRDFELFGPNTYCAIRDAHMATKVALADPITQAAMGEGK